jgi:hypothetical protein
LAYVLKMTGIFAHDYLPLGLCNRVLADPEAVTNDRFKLLFLVYNSIWFVSGAAHQESA